jgi:hypothetical protein
MLPLKIKRACHDQMLRNLKPILSGKAGLSKEQVLLLSKRLLESPSYFDQEKYQDDFDQYLTNQYKIEQHFSFLLTFLNNQEPEYADIARDVLMLSIALLRLPPLIAEALYSGLQWRRRAELLIGLQVQEQLACEHWQILAEVCRRYPVKVSLNLGEYHLVDFSNDAYTAFCDLLQSGAVVFLGLGNGKLNELTAERWKNLWQSACHVREFNLSHNDLHQLNLAKLRIWAETIRDQSFKTFKLSSNKLSSVTDQPSWSLLCEILTHVSSVELGANMLEILSAQHWECLQKACEKSRHCSLNDLNLEFNDMGNTTKERWCAFWDFIAHSKITALDLAHNNLYLLFESTQLYRHRANCLLLAAIYTTNNLSASNHTSINNNQEYIETLRSDLQKKWKAFYQALEISSLHYLNLADNHLTDFDASIADRANKILLKKASLRSLVHLTLFQTYRPDSPVPDEALEKIRHIFPNVDIMGAYGSDSYPFTLFNPNNFPYHQFHGQVANISSQVGDCSTQHTDSLVL